VSLDEKKMLAIEGMAKKTVEENLDEESTELGKERENWRKKKKNKQKSESLAKGPNETVEKKRIMETVVAEDLENGKTINNDNKVNNSDSENDKFEMGKIRIMEGENGPEVCNVKNPRKVKNKAMISVRKSKVIENEKMERKYKDDNNGTIGEINWMTGGEKNGKIKEGKGKKLKNNQTRKGSEKEEGGKKKTMEIAMRTRGKGASQKMEETKIGDKEGKEGSSGAFNEVDMTQLDDGTTNWIGQGEKEDPKKLGTQLEGDNEATAEDEGAGTDSDCGGMEEEEEELLHEEEAEDYGDEEDCTEREEEQREEGQVERNDLDMIGDEKREAGSDEEEAVEEMNEVDEYNEIQTTGDGNWSGYLRGGGNIGSSIDSEEGGRSEGTGAIKTAREVKVVEKNKKEMDNEGNVGGKTEGNIMKDKIMYKGRRDGEWFGTEVLPVSSPLVDASRLDKPGLILSPEDRGDGTVRDGVRLPEVGATGCLCLVSEGRDDDSDATPVVSPISPSGNAGDGAVRVRVAD
jgi:hypothetical protein